MSAKIDTWQIMADFLPKIEEIDFLDDTFLLINYSNNRGERRFALAARIENEFMIATSERYFGIYTEDSDGYWHPTEETDKGTYFWIDPDDAEFDIWVRRSPNEEYRRAKKVRFQD